MNRTAILALLTTAVLSSCQYASAPTQTAKGQGKSLDSTPRYGYNNSSPTTETLPPRVVDRPTPKPRPKPTPEPESPSEPAVTNDVTETLGDPIVNGGNTPTVDVPDVVTKPVEIKIPYAKPIPGQPGRVYSPFNGKPVDVSNLSPGSRASDPYTGEQFRVP